MKRDYRNLKSGMSYFRMDTNYVKRGKKLFELEPTYEYLTKKQIEAIHGNQVANKMTEFNTKYSFPTRMDEETLEKLKSYLMQILSC
jgi:hypothetical protein